MWKPFRQSLEQWALQCRIVYDKFHILQHVGQAVDEVRRAEFFRRGGAARDLVRGKRWLLLSSWLNLDRGKRRQLNALFTLNQGKPLVELHLRRGHVALPAELDRPVTLAATETDGEASRMLLDHLEGILNYCRTKVPMGVIEAVNGNIKALLRRGRGYRAATVKRCSHAGRKCISKK
jgi:transposase